MYFYTGIIKSPIACLSLVKLSRRFNHKFLCYPDACLNFYIEGLQSIPILFDYLDRNSATVINMPEYDV